MTDHADTVREALTALQSIIQSGECFTETAAATWCEGVAALDALVAERDKLREAASWLLANRGHRGEQQAWKLLADALGDNE